MNWLGGLALTWH